jgi:putative membrane protein insertion efficiency factor
MRLLDHLASAARWIAKAPVHGYRWTTCSEYALDAIDRNGAWRGCWLATSRICRCNPWGTSGFDPAPDITAENHPFAPWRYGRWRHSQLCNPAPRKKPAA